MFLRGWYLELEKESFDVTDKERKIQFHLNPTQKTQLESLVSETREVTVFFCVVILDDPMTLKGSLTPWNVFSTWFPKWFVGLSSGTLSFSSEGEFLECLYFLMRLTVRVWLFLSAPRDLPQATCQFSWAIFPVVFPYYWSSQLSLCCNTFAISWICFPSFSSRYTVSLKDKGRYMTDVGIFIPSEAPGP